MALFSSYAISLQASKTVGTTLSDKTTDGINSLHQALNNNLEKGTVFKLDIELTSNELQVINLAALGLRHVRSILLKSDNQFGYSIVTPSAIADAEPYWYLVRTAFIDFNNKIPTTLTNPKYKPTENLNIIKVESPLATHPQATLANPTPTIVVQLIVISE